MFVFTYFRYEVTLQHHILQKMIKFVVAFVFLLSVNSMLFSNNPIFDIEHVIINLEFDWAKKRAIGNCHLNLTIKNTTRLITLDAGMLTINRLLLNGKTLQFDCPLNDKPHNFIIHLDREYHKDEFFTLKISYHTNHVNHSDPNAIWGSFGKGLRFFQPTSTTPKKQKQIWNSGEPDGNKYWFPGSEDIADIHTTEMLITVDKNFTALGNGELINLIDNRDNTHTFHYKSKNPFPNYLVSIVVGEYALYEQKLGTTTIQNYGYYTEMDAVRSTTELLPDMLKFLEEKTGFQYPYSNYKQVVVQDYPFPGLVGQNTMAILSDNYIDDYGVHKDFKYLWDGVAVQALTNQWFGNLIMPKSWKDIWLNNAFGQYFAGLYTAKNNGKDEYLTYVLPWEKTNVWNDWANGNRHPIVTDSFSDISKFTSDSYSKYRGALVLHMLQRELGDDLWWEVVRKFVNQYAFKQVSTSEFQKVIEEVSNHSYQWFFDQWIYKIGLPKFEITKSYNKNTKQLTLNLKQVPQIDSLTKYNQVRYFEGKVEIEIDGSSNHVLIEPKEINQYYFDCSNRPSYVHFNKNDIFLCEYNFEKSYDEYLKQLQKSNDVLAKQIALDHLVVAILDSNIANSFKAKCINEIKKETLSNQYWRYRNYALGSLSKVISLPYDESLVSLLKKIIYSKDNAWLRASALNILGKSQKMEYEPVYIEALKDSSDRVINTAAIALGKTKSTNAFEALMGLEQRHSWKNQNRISALNGLAQLGDARALDYVLNCIKDNSSPRWYLATPVWDYPFAAIHTLVRLGKSELAYPILMDRFKHSLEEDDINDIFQNVQLIDLLADKRAVEMYELLKQKFYQNSTVLESIKVYEANYLQSIKTD